ncbi:hypothetical protein BHM03_00034769 [Ensete ventricosum]|nr:hypothetical protein BHM03_00034769 [Ensete ventricosum]
MRIARGAARGLAYLHDGSPRKLVHGDLKPSNILLDADFNPRISDFGLLRLLSFAASPSSTDAAAPSSSNTGLLGAALPQSAKSTHLDLPSPYRAPEARAAAAALPTQKSDVYSFGVVLMEMLTGKPPEMSSPSPSSSSGEQVPGLVRWVRKGFEEARPLTELADPVLLHDVHAKKELAAAFHVALACTDVEPLARPRMKTVSEKLDRIVS